MPESQTSEAEESRLALPPSRSEGSAAQRVAEAILDFVGHIPGSQEEQSPLALDRARAVAKSASQKAALTAGSLALPPGPLGWLTMLPEMVAVWKIQAQMVSDIAALYGKQTQLTREQMLYCLFRHMAAQAMRDFVVRFGERFIVQQLTRIGLQGLAKKIGVKLTEKIVGKTVARWLPVAGAMGVAAYAYFDTGKVAATAIELFSGEIEVTAITTDVVEQ